METVGKRMLAARKAVKPRMSRDKATRRLAERYPDQEIVPKTLQRLENDDPSAINVARLSALCDVYGTSLKEVAPEYLHESRALADLLVRTSTWRSGTGNSCLTEAA